MSTNSAKHRSIELIKQINRHNALYYDQGVTEISDSEYDSLMNELKQIEALHPELSSMDSPTQNVGGSALSEFEKVSHQVPMLSIEDIHELKPEELTGRLRPTENLRDWYDRIVRAVGEGNFTLAIEPKIDGVAIALRYEDGELKYAATRGDGATGDDVTQNVLTIKSIPKKLNNIPKVFEIRGEIFMNNIEFAEMNEKQVESGLPAFKNPRNATAGTVKQLDPKLVALRPLDCIFHSFGEITPFPFESITSFQDTLTKLKLRHSPWFKTVNTLEEMLDAVEELEKDRHDLPYATDGAVIKVNELSLHDEIGYTSKFPKWASAFKYLPQQVETTIETITIQVGRTGVLTPVAELTPVDVSGTTVARATLHNEEEIQRKDIRIGDRVIIEKAGEIIPAVVKVLVEQRTHDNPPFSLYSYVDGKCPSCDGSISQEEGFVAWRCTNPMCSAKLVTKITHFTQRKALDIDSIGESVAEKLISEGLVTTPLDLFSLEEGTLANLMLDPAVSPSGEVISKERRFGEKRAQKALSSLENAKTNMPLSRWLFGLGIPHIGEGAAKEVSRLHKNLLAVTQSSIIETIYAIGECEEERKLISPNSKINPPKSEEEKSERKAQYDQIKKEKEALAKNVAEYQIKSDLGAVASGSIFKYFHSEPGQKLIVQLEELGINPESNNYRPVINLENSDSSIAGKTFVITGTLSQSRGYFKDLIEREGGNVSGSISKKTSYLLAGEKAGSKLTKAESLGVTILDESTFMALI